LTAVLDIIYTAAMLTGRRAFHHEQSVCDGEDRGVTRSHSNRRRNMITKHNKTQHFEKSFPYSSPKRSLDETGPTAQAHLTLSNSTRCSFFFPLFFSGCLNLSRFVSFSPVATCIFSQKTKLRMVTSCQSCGVISFLAPQSGRSTQNQDRKCGPLTYAMGILPHCKVTPANTTTYELHFSGELAKGCTRPVPNQRFFTKNAVWPIKIAVASGHDPQKPGEEGDYEGKTKKKACGFVVPAPFGRVPSGGRLSRSLLEQRVQNASREMSWNAASAASLGSFEQVNSTAANRCRFSYLTIE
jgi:hypothetical protein